MSESGDSHVLLAVNGLRIREFMCQHHLVDGRVAALNQRVGFLEMDKRPIVIAETSQRESADFAVDSNHAASDIRLSAQLEQPAYHMVIALMEIVGGDSLGVTPFFDKRQTIVLVFAADSRILIIRIEPQELVQMVLLLVELLAGQASQRVGIVQVIGSGLAVGEFACKMLELSEKRQFVLINTHDLQVRTLVLVNRIYGHQDSVELLGVQLAHRHQDMRVGEPAAVGTQNTTVLINGHLVLENIVPCHTAVEMQIREVGL